MQTIPYSELTIDKAREGCFVLDMPNEAYHAYDGISKSGLDIINRSPAHYFFNSYSEPSPAMLMGTAVHTAILEPERFKDDYLILDVKDKRTSAYKEAVKARGVERVLLKKDYERIATMQEVIAADNEASELLAGCDLFEVSAFVGIPDTDIILRCRYDAFNTREGVAVDLKTTRSSEPNAFAKSVYDYRYHVQAALYSDVFEMITGERLKRFAFLAVENDLPHCPMVYDLDDDALHIGRLEYELNLVEYGKALQSGNWHGYEKTGEPLSLPNWVLNQYENELLDGGIV